MDDPIYAKYQKGILLCRVCMVACGIIGLICLGVMMLSDFDMAVIEPAAKILSTVWVIGIGGGAVGLTILSEKQMRHRLDVLEEQVRALKNARH